jgi:hypothetical protein
VLSHAGNKGENKTLDEYKVWAASFNPRPERLYVIAFTAFRGNETSTTSPDFSIWPLRVGAEQQHDR